MRCSRALWHAPAVPQSQPASYASADLMRAVACRRTAADAIADQIVSWPSIGAGMSVLQRRAAAARRRRRGQRAGGSVSGVSCAGPALASLRRHSQAVSGAATVGDLWLLHRRAHGSVVGLLGGQGIGVAGLSVPWHVGAHRECQLAADLIFIAGFVVRMVALSAVCSISTPCACVCVPHGVRHLTFAIFQLSCALRSPDKENDEVRNAFGIGCRAKLPYIFLFRCLVRCLIISTWALYETHVDDQTPNQTTK